MSFLPRFLEWQQKLRKQGFRVLAPKLVDERLVHSDRESLLKSKRIDNRKHFRNIKSADAILVLNYSKDSSNNYIGGSTFAEISVAFYLHKRIFLVNPAPTDSPFFEELEAWQVRQWPLDAVTLKSSRIKKEM